MRLDWGMHVMDGPARGMEPAGPAAAAARAQAVSFVVDLDGHGHAHALRSWNSKGSASPRSGNGCAKDDSLVGVVQPMRLLASRFGLAAEANKLLTIQQAYLVLGGLRAALRDLEDYNASFAPPSSPSEACDVVSSALVRVRAASLLRDIGITPGEPVGIEDLRLLVDVIEESCAEKIALAREELLTSTISFDSLVESYPPLSRVVIHVGPGNLELGLSVRGTWFQQRETLFGVERSCHLELEFVARVGSHFAVLTCRRVLEYFAGYRQLSELPVRHLHLGVNRSVYAEEQVLASLASRGLRYVDATDGYQLRAYEAGAFLQGGTSKPLARGARCIVDVESAIAAGVPVAAGDDAASQAVRQASEQLALLKKQGQLCGETIQRHAAAKLLLADSLVLLEDVPASLQWCLFPAVPAFSLEERCFGHVPVESVHPITWTERDRVWDALVIPAAEKELLRAVLLNSVEDSQACLTRGRAEGATFLLRGLPGTGKTFTIETVAEFLRRPLLAMNAQELGRSQMAVSETLESILRLCRRWGCVFAIDDVDSLPDRQDEQGSGGGLIWTVMHNLEQHADMVFLTAGLSSSLDPIVTSRLTLALEYRQLDVEARLAVWRGMISKVVGKDACALFDLNLYASPPLDGWQIKNVIRLALAVARERGQTLKQEFIVQALAANTSKRSSELTTASRQLSPRQLSPRQWLDCTEQDVFSTTVVRPASEANSDSVRDFAPTWPLAGRRSMQDCNSARSEFSITETDPGSVTCSLELALAVNRDDGLPAMNGTVPALARDLSPPRAWTVDEATKADASPQPTARPFQTQTPPLATPAQVESPWPTSRPGDVEQPGCEPAMIKGTDGSTGTTMTPGSSLDVKPLAQDSGAAPVGKQDPVTVFTPRHSCASKTPPAAEVPKAECAQQDSNIPPAAEDQQLRRVDAAVVEGEMHGPRPFQWQPQEEEAMKDPQPTQFHASPQPSRTHTPQRKALSHLSQPGQLSPQPSMYTKLLQQHQYQQDPLFSPTPPMHPRQPLQQPQQQSTQQQQHEQMQQREQLQQQQPQHIPQQMHRQVPQQLSQVQLLQQPSQSHQPNKQMQQPVEMQNAYQQEHTHQAYQQHAQPHQLQHAQSMRLPIQPGQHWQQHPLPNQQQPHAQSPQLQTASLSLPVTASVKHVFPGSPASPAPRGSNLAASMAMSPAPRHPPQGPLLVHTMVSNHSVTSMTRSSPIRNDSRFSSPFRSSPASSWRQTVGACSGASPLGYHGGYNFPRSGSVGRHGRQSPAHDRQVPLPTWPVQQSDSPQTYVEHAFPGLHASPPAERQASYARLRPPLPDQVQQTSQAQLGIQSQPKAELEAQPTSVGKDTAAAREAKDAETPRFTGPVMERCRNVKLGSARRAEL